MSKSKSSAIPILFSILLWSCGGFQLREAIKKYNVDRIHILEVTSVAPSALFDEKLQTVEKKDPYFSVNYSFSYGIYKTLEYKSDLLSRKLSDSVKGEIEILGSRCGRDPDCLERNQNGICVRYRGAKIESNCKNCKLIASKANGKNFATSIKNTYEKSLYSNLEGVVQPESVTEKLPGYKQIVAEINKKLEEGSKKGLSPRDNYTEMFQDFINSDPKFKSFLDSNPKEAFILVVVTVSNELVSNRIKVNESTQEEVANTA